MKGCRAILRIGQVLAGSQAPWQLGDAAHHSFLPIFLGNVMGRFQTDMLSGNLVEPLLSTDPSMSLTLLSIPPQGTSHLLFY